MCSAFPNLVARGDNINGEDSGLHGVFVRPTGFTGAADPRREGVAIVPESLP
jgi:gamma-glutamyltranspeptidase